MTCGIVLGISLRFHHHVPQQLAIDLVFYKPATNQVGGDKLRWVAEGGIIEVQSDEMGSYAGGLKIGLALGNLPDKV